MTWLGSGVVFQRDGVPRVSAVVVLASVWCVTPASAAAGGTKLWVAKYTAGFGGAVSTAASPDGSRLYVTGSSDPGTGERNNFVTIAYNPATGAQLWLASYHSGFNFDDYVQALAVSPDGTKVFVTGVSGVGPATVAYNAATGAQLWVKRFFGGAGRAIAVSPDSSKVFITGPNSGPNGDYLTTAYQASTGTRLWSATWAGPDGLNDAANAIGVTPDGARVIVTGYNVTNARGYEWLTVAYSASTGAQLWFNRFNATVGEFEDIPSGLAVSPDGSFVAVTGYGHDSASTGDMHHRRLQHPQRRATVARHLPRPSQQRRQHGCRRGGQPRLDQGVRDRDRRPGTRTPILRDRCLGRSHRNAPVGHSLRRASRRDRRQLRQLGRGQRRWLRRGRDRRQSRQVWAWI